MREPSAIKLTLSFASGIVLVGIAYALLSVYVIGEFEPRWGRGGSFQVICWLALAAAVIASVSFAIGLAWMRKNKRFVRGFNASSVAFIVGASACLALLGLLYTRGAMGSPWVAALILAIASALVPFLFTHQSPSNGGDG